MENEEVLTVTCRTHGERQSAFICRHLNGASNQGFYRPDEEDKQSLQAWCYQCEVKLQELGGWPDSQETIDNFQTVCDCCFAKTELLNRVLVISGQTIH